MNSVIKASVALAVLVTIVSVIFVAAGLHESSPMLGIVLIVLFIGLNIGCLFWALSPTAAVNGYGKQMLSVVIFGVVAAVVIFGLSMLQTTVLFPDYIDESTTAMIEFFEDMDMPEDALQQQIAKAEARTPMGEARNGAIGTLITSLIVGAIVSIFKRKKS